MYWSGVDYLWIIVMFLSAVWTLILTAPIHCTKWCNATFLQISWRNKLIYILNSLKVHFHKMFIFGWTIPLKIWVGGGYEPSLPLSCCFSVWWCVFKSYWCLFCCLSPVALVTFALDICMIHMCRVTDSLRARRAFRETLQYSLHFLWRWISNALFLYILHEFYPMHNHKVWCSLL